MIPDIQLVFECVTPTAPSASPGCCHVGCGMGKTGAITLVPEQDGGPHLVSYYGIGSKEILPLPSLLTPLSLGVEGSSSWLLEPKPLGCATALP